MPKFQFRETFPLTDECGAYKAPAHIANRRVIYLSENFSNPLNVLYDITHREIISGKFNERVIAKERGIIALEYTYVYREIGTDNIIFDRTIDFVGTVSVMYCFGELGSEGELEIDENGAKELHLLVEQGKKESLERRIRG